MRVACLVPSITETLVDDMDRRKTLLLFSSEPFPFERYCDELKASGFAAALVEGECFSWYGIRSLKFLEDTLPRVST